MFELFVLNLYNYWLLGYSFDNDPFPCHEWLLFSCLSYQLLSLLNFLSIEGTQIIRPSCMGGLSKDWETHKYGWTEMWVVRHFWQAKLFFLFDCLCLGVALDFQQPVSFCSNFRRLVKVIKRLINFGQENYFWCWVSCRYNFGLGLWLILRA